MRPGRALVSALVALLATLASAPAGRAQEEARSGKRRPDPGCMSCHGGIEVMHPWAKLSCTDCHGGDGTATAKDKAHVAPTRPVPHDERTVPLRYDLDYRRFENPADLRVAERTCGRCHDEICANLKKSLHGTTAGHLSDGLYENGVVRKRTDRFSIFPVRDDDGEVPDHAYRLLPQIPPAYSFKDSDIGTHFADLPRKSCMQCHLYSRGVGLRGRLGQDGWYRSEGCAACHVTYAEDGLTKSADRTIPRLEPGHPVKHELTSKIPVATCTRCHALDASIGSSFRGLAQLPPGCPGGPDVPGTTNRLEKGRFFLDDKAICPPDIHFEKGMVCVDCHGARDVMGDGNIWGVMERGVGVTCQTCHGTFAKKADFRTERGDRLDNLRWEKGKAILKSRVSGKDHVIPQVVDVLDPKSPAFNPRAKKAMTKKHARLTCYACHNGWSVNFFGFHFDRNASFTQLDVLSGRRTPGRVTTQEKVFSTFRHFYLGFDSKGRIAPYLVGFSSCGTYHDEKGRTRLRQAMPVTSKGLSGMTLISHQLHTVRPAARRCDECHADADVLGCGSNDFLLFRDLFVVAGDAGLSVCGLDSKNPGQSRILANVSLPSRPRGVGLANDPLQGHAQFAYVPCRDGKVYVVDVRDAVSPRVRDVLPTKDARAVCVRDKTLLVAGGSEGLCLFSLKNPIRPRLLSRLQTVEARGVSVDGPFAYVADGPGGLKVVDCTDPEKPVRIAAAGAKGSQANAVLVESIVARPDVAHRSRTPMHTLAFVADGTHGLEVYDVTSLFRPALLSHVFARGFSARALAFASHYDIGSTGGDIPSVEREYLYVAGVRTQNRTGALYKLDVSNPARPILAGQRVTVGDPASVAIACVYEAPFLKQYALVAGRGRGDLEISDVTTRTAAIPQVGLVPGIGPAAGLDLETMPLDRLVGFRGEPLKDVSHEGAHLFTKAEIARILKAGR